MDTGDWLVNALANDDIPGKIKAMWVPIEWGAANIDTIHKIMGQAPCSKEERDKIKKYLYNEHKYELLVAMIYADKYEICQDDDKSRIIAEDYMSSHSDNTAFQNISKWQLLSFLRWCDEKDMRDIFEKPSAIDIYRLSYIALAIGYKKLALLLVSTMDKEKAEIGIANLEKYGKMSSLLFRKWLCDFYYKQPEGKNKNKLAKRLVRYGTQLLTHY